VKRITLISGLPPSNGGVGRLMQALITSADSQVDVIYPDPQKSESIKKLLLNKRFYQSCKEIYKRIFGGFWYFKLYFMKGEACICIHPQTIGFSLLLRIIKRNIVYLYVMDNSFFCITSYNYDTYNKSECLRCVNFENSPRDTCKSFPVEYSVSENTNFIRDLYEVGFKLRFLCQNENQKKLLNTHFGRDVMAITVGMNTNELGGIFPSRVLSDGYDFIYHGADSLAKGLGYFIEIAQKMTKFSFFIPINKKHCESLINKTIDEVNITFEDCNWETGLKEIVVNSKFTINPSLWSAPIEGALIKSIFYGQNIFVVESEYGFENEIANKFNIERLPVDCNLAVIALNKAMMAYKYDERVFLKRGRELLTFMSSENIFTVVRSDLE